MAYEAWLVATLKLVVNVVGTLNRKEQLRHHAVSLRQHGFLKYCSFMTYIRNKLRREPLQIGVVI